MAWYNVLLNKNRLTKMADLGIIFLRRKHTISLIPVIIYSYYRKYAVPFFLGHPVYSTSFSCWPINYAITFLWYYLAHQNYAVM